MWAAPFCNEVQRTRGMFIATLGFDVGWTVGLLFRGWKLVHCSTSMSLLKVALLATTQSFRLVRCMKSLAILHLTRRLGSSGSIEQRTMHTGTASGLVDDFGGLFLGGTWFAAVDRSCRGMVCGYLLQGYQAWGGEWEQKGRPLCHSESSGPVSCLL